MTKIYSDHGIGFTVSPEGFEIDFSTDVDMASVKSMSKLLNIAYDYYKFNKVCLNINSPGGHGNAMIEGLKIIDNFRRKGKAVNVSAGHCCASAAAILLANGAWGYRTVVPTTKLLFHFGRMQIQDINLTRERASSFAQKLAMVDQQMVAQLVSILCQGAGSEDALRQEMSSRCESLIGNWDKVHADLCSHNIFPLNLRGPWLKTLATASSYGKSSSLSDLSGQFTDWLTRHLRRRFDEDTEMDLREAYALCLVDRVEGVLPHLPTIESQFQIDMEVTRVTNRPMNG